LKTLPQREVSERVEEIWTEFLAPDASCPVNVDSHSHEITKRNMAKPDRWTFDPAAVPSTYLYYIHSEIYISIYLVLYDN
jgi:regulator of G-protein signaling